MELAQADLVTIRESHGSSRPAPVAEAEVELGATPYELDDFEQYEQAIDDPVDGGDHSFRVKGAKRDDREIGADLAEPAAAFVREVVG